MGFEEVPNDPSLADPLPPSPFPLLARWLREARDRSGQRNPDAMALATVGPDGRPSARMVLCRGFDETRGVLVFYTNRESGKGAALRAHPHASACFYWDGMGRQARVAGPVVPSPDAESDAYFAGRDRLSQLAAWGSEQSRPVESRGALLARLEAAAARFGGVRGDAPVPRPPHWGGYRIWAERVELWVNARGRAHDRALWTRKLEHDGDDVRPADPGNPGAWQVTRLQP